MQKKTYFNNFSVWMNHTTLTMLRNWLIWATVHAWLPEKFDSSLKITHPRIIHWHTFLRDFYYRGKLFCSGSWILRLTIIVLFGCKLRFLGLIGPSWSVIFIILLDQSEILNFRSWSGFGPWIPGPNMYFCVYLIIVGHILFYKNSYNSIFEARKPF